MSSRAPGRGSSLITLTALALAACSSRTRSAADAAASADAPALAYEHCARAGGKAPAPLRWGSVQLVPRGELLEPAAGAKPAARVILGVLGDTKEALPATLEQIERLAALFKRRGAAGIVVLGGLDTSFEGIRAVLERLRGLPVVGLPGDRESRSGWQAAVEALGERGADLTRARAVVVPGASLLGVPGYFLPHHLMAREQGCSYSREDLRALAHLGRSLPEPRLLVSHGPPRGSGPAAVDRAFGGVNIGDPLLTTLLEEAKLRFGVFAHVHEAAGHATTLDGRPVAEAQWSESLLLNVGSADSVPHEDLGGRWSRGTAALLELEPGRARYHWLSPGSANGSGAAQVGRSGAAAATNKATENHKAN